MHGIYSKVMYKEKQDKTKHNWAAASGTRMTANATATAAGEVTTAGVAGADLGEDNRKQDGEEDSEEEDIQEKDAEEDETQAQRITQK